MKSVLLMGVMVCLVVLTGAISVAMLIASILSLVEYKFKILPRGSIVLVHSPSVVLVVLLRGHVRVVN